MGTQLEWIAERARDRSFVFTNLAHHLDENRLRSAYRHIRKDGAWGVDRTSAQAYGAHLDANLKDVHARLRDRRYQPPPLRRAWIPKASGAERPIGIPTFEDKIVQRAVADLLEPVYEATFHNFSGSSGIRVGNSETLGVEIETSGVKVDRIAEALAAAKASRDALDPLNLLVDPLRVCVCHV